MHASEIRTRFLTYFPYFERRGHTIRAGAPHDALHDASHDAPALVAPVLGGA